MGITQSVYEFEEQPKGCSTPPAIRILPKKYDPRSPTEGIDRTPIEVASTPKPSKIQGNALTFSPTENDVKNEEKHMNEVENKTNEAKLQSSVELDNKTKKTEPKKYLETDIDAVDKLLVPALKHPRVRELCSKKPTPAVLPEETGSVNQEDSLASRIDSLSFMDLTLEDPSVIVSDNEEIVNKSGRPVQEWLITIEDECENVTFECSADNAAFQKSDALNDSQLPLVSAQTDCRTPEENCQTPNRKVRTPLGCITPNTVFESNSAKIKQWRGIQEERQRRGLSLADENTPPLPPPLDKVSSAPGKLVRRRNFAEWDDETTMLI